MACMIVLAVRVAEGCKSGTDSACAAGHRPVHAGGLGNADTATQRPVGLLQCSLTLLLDSVKPLKLREGGASLELDGNARHGPTGVCEPIEVPGSPCAKRAG